MLMTACAIALWLPALLQADLGASGDERGDARGLTQGPVLELRGRLDDELVGANVVLRFDTAGRFHADHEYGPLRDAAFDGAELWTVDRAGRPYLSMGRERDMLLVMNGLLSGNWLAGQRWDRDPGPGGRGLYRLAGRSLEVVVEVDADGLPRRVDTLALGRERSLVFHDWRATEHGKYPGRVDLLDTGQVFATVVFSSLTLADDWDFGPPMDAGATVSFDPEAPRDLEVRIIPSGHSFVRALLEGEDLGWFAFDTGASGTILDAGVASRAGLRSTMHGARTSGAGGTVELSIVRPESLQVGPLHWEAPILTAIDLSALERAFGVSPLVGILGADLFVHAAWEYDLQHERIRVHPPEHGIDAESWVAIELYDGQLVTPLRVEGHDLRFILDTGGGGGLSFRAPTVERLKLTEGRRLTRSWVRGVGGRVRVPRGTIERAVFGGRVHENLQASFGTSELPGAWLDPYVDGVMGITFLRPQPVLFDYPRRRIGLLARDE